MPVEPPITSQTRDAILASIESELNQATPLLPLAFNRVMAAALAGLYQLIYKYAGFWGLQIFVSTASFKPVSVLGKIVTPLVEIGREIGVSDPTAGTRAQLSLQVTVITQGGSLLGGTQLLGVTNGVTYSTNAGVLLNAPTVTVTATAIADQADGDGSGTIGNLPVAGELSFANAPAVVERIATVLGSVVTGADPESEDSYRARVARTAAFPPQGGAPADYVEWSTEVAGIVNAYPYTNDPNEAGVEVFIEAEATLTQPDGIPTAAQLAAAAASIETVVGGLASRRPVGAFVTTAPITRRGFTVTINGTTGIPDPAQTQTDLDAAFTEFFLNSEPFVFGATLRPRSDTITRTRLAGIAEDIITSVGGSFTSVTFASDVTHQTYVLQPGEKAKLLSVVVL